MSTSVGSTMEGRRSQSYETAGMDRPRRTGSSYHLDYAAYSRADVQRTRQEWKQAIIQFHGMLEDAIRRSTSVNFNGLFRALKLYEGYFGYFGEEHANTKDTR